MSECSQPFSITHLNMHIGVALNGKWIAWVELANAYRLVSMNPESKSNTISSMNFDTREEAFSHALELGKMFVKASREELVVRSMIVGNNKADKGTFSGMVSLVVPRSKQVKSEKTVALFFIDKRGANEEHIPCPFKGVDEVGAMVEDTFKRIVFADPRIMVHLGRDTEFNESSPALQPSSVASELPSVTTVITDTDRTCAEREIG